MDFFTKDWWLRVVKGALVGIGGILPGLSGGVLAVIFGLYDKIINFFGNITKNFWKNVLYFIPVGIGFCLGVIIFSFFVKEAFGAYEGLFTCLFIGFVIGTFPSLYQEAGKKGRHTSDLLIMLGSATLLFSIMVLGGNNLMKVEPSFLSWLFSGILIGLGIVVPGMSPSNFLIYLGLYAPMSAGIAVLDLSVIIPLTLGGALCILGLSKLASWLFERYYSQMYHIILGTVIGSSLAIFPTVVFPTFTPFGLHKSGLTFTSTIIMSILMLVGGIAFSLWFSRIEARYR